MLLPYDLNKVLLVLILAFKLYTELYLLRKIIKIILYCLQIIKFLIQNVSKRKNVPLFPLQTINTFLYFLVVLFFYTMFAGLMQVCPCMFLDFVIVIIIVMRLVLLISRIINSKIFSSNNSPVGVTAAPQADLLSAGSSTPFLASRDWVHSFL